MNAGILERELREEAEGLGIQSPIEMPLYIALQQVALAQGIPCPAVETFYDHTGQHTYRFGLSITPQFQVGPYRVDFLCEYGLAILDGPQWLNRLLVECDSQQFHERTVAQRRYEKKRDRYVQSQGWRIFHYTGSEILARPGEIADEILTTLQRSQRPR